MRNFILCAIMCLTSTTTFAQTAAKDSIVYISRSTYVFDGKYRLIFDLSSGATAVYDEYDTKEECEAAIEKMVEDNILYT